MPDFLPFHYESKNSIFNCILIYDLDKLNFVEKKQMPPEPIDNLSNHLANERTFLAWVRTSIGVMAFGFVVVKFSLFIKEIGIVLQKPLTVSSHGYSEVMGIFLVGFGVLIGLIAFFRFRRINQQISENSYRPSTSLSTLLTVCIVLIGICLVIYLIHSV
jgi:uncharacterized membrane protein YidH (DUF202 family)